MIKTFNPYNEEKIAEYHEYSSERLSEICDNAYKAFREWKAVPFSEKANLLKNVSSLLRFNDDKYAAVITQEMGKPYKQSLAEIEKCAWVCDYYAENAEMHLKSIDYETEFSRSYVKYEPLGPVLAIMPWNFPFWQVFRFAAPNLMAGNTGLLKHSSNTTGCSIEIEHIFNDAGFPDYVFKSLLIKSDKVEEVINNPNVKAVTLTGSTPVGQKVASSAGKLIKRTVLELGGSDPYIILNDADIDLAVNACATGRMINSGQSCIAAKRFIVEKDILNDFSNKLTERFKQEVVGNPYNENTTVGPLARRDLRDELDKQVKQSIERGAELLIGGNLHDGKGYFYEPTILTNVTPGMPAFDEELFGPVAVIISAENTQEAIELANNTEFGLGAAIFSKDINKAESIASEIETGSVFINDFVKSDPRLPFGGVKMSGYGRELSDMGIKEFLNAKTICVR